MELAAMGSYLLLGQCPCSGGGSQQTSRGDNAVWYWLILLAVMSVWWLWRNRRPSGSNSIGGGVMKSSLLAIAVLAVVIAAGGIWLAKGANNKGPATDATAGSGNTSCCPSLGGLLERDASSPTPPATAPDARTGLPRLIDLGAKTCIPCKMMAPILEDLKKTYADQFVTEFIDVRDNPQAGRKHGIQAIPTQIFFDAAGRELYRHEGFLSKEAILAKWKELGVAVR